MKTDTPGFLDVKLTVVTKDKTPWLEGLAAIGAVESEETNGDWTIRRVPTSAKLGELTIRVIGYVVNKIDAIDTDLFGPLADSVAAAAGLDGAVGLGVFPWRP